MSGRWWWATARKWENRGKLRGPCAAWIGQRGRLRFAQSPEGGTRKTHFPRSGQKVSSGVSAMEVMSFGLSGDGVENRFEGFAAVVRFPDGFL